MVSSERRARSIGATHHREQANKMKSAQGELPRVIEVIAKKANQSVPQNLGQMTNNQIRHLGSKVRARLES